MAEKTVGLITIENARFMFRPNFTGAEETYNVEGHRYFNVRIPDDIVDAVVKDGWNVKWTKEREEFPSEPYLEVSLNFKYRPPEIYLIEDGRQTPVTEKTVAMLDSVEFDNIDVVIRPYAWESAMGSGIKAYLKTFYGTLVMDDLQRKYARLRAEQE